MLGIIAFLRSLYFIDRIIHCFIACQCVIVAFRMLTYADVVRDRREGTRILPYEGTTITDSSIESIRGRRSSECSDSSDHSINFGGISLRSLPSLASSTAGNVGPHAYADSIHENIMSNMSGFFVLDWRSYRTPATVSFYNN